MPFTSWASHPKTLQREALRVSLRHFVVSEPPPRFCQQQFAALAYLTQIFRGASGFSVGKEPAAFEHGRPFAVCPLTLSARTGRRTAR